MVKQWGSFDKNKTKNYSEAQGGVGHSSEQVTGLFT